MAYVDKLIDQNTWKVTNYFATITGKEVTTGEVHELRLKEFVTRSGVKYIWARNGDARMFFSKSEVIKVLKSYDITIDDDVSNPIVLTSSPIISTIQIESTTVTVSETFWSPK